MNAVLAAFMTGLSLCAHLCGRFSRRTQQPLAAYGVLELLVVVGVALSPLGFALIQPAFVFLARFTLGSMFSLSLLRRVSAMLVMIVPITAMGAALPRLARLVEEHSDERSRQRALGVFYAEYAGRRMGSHCIGACSSVAGAGGDVAGMGHTADIFRGPHEKKW